MAQAIQLAIEYDPQPPFDAGSPTKAGPELVALVQTVLADPARRARRRLSLERASVGGGGGLGSQVLEGAGRDAAGSMNASTSERFSRITRPKR